MKGREGKIKTDNNKRARVPWLETSWRTTGKKRYYNFDAIKKL